MSKNKKEYNKLIRDKIIDLLLDENKEYSAIKLDKKKFIKSALDKLEEETIELREAVVERDKEKISEELCDLMELVYAVAKHYNISEEKLTNMREEKSRTVGNFDSMIFLEYVVENETPAVPTV
jgi:predicted house-cleaning noncanonical NTP pyrophosphatase (MazG superfamily)